MDILLRLFAIPLTAHAHEVYVLPSATIKEALATPSFSLWEVVIAHSSQFLFWAFIGMLVVAIVFFVSISRFFEKRFDPFLATLPPYAPVVGRITIGLSFLAAAYYQALFGPELPLTELFGSLAPAVTVLLVVCGISCIIGFHARIAALLMLGVFLVTVFEKGTYMLTYTNYAGELILLSILGAHTVAVHTRDHDEERAAAWLLRIKDFLQPYAFTFLRVGFGISLLYASLYAKVLHNNLALAVATQYPGLVSFFGFEPHFLVLGAAIIEILIGFFFIIGIEIRFASLFLLFWLSLSLWYFGEVVWPHLILIGIPIAFLFYGYDKYSLEGSLLKDSGGDPVL